MPFLRLWCTIVAMSISTSTARCGLCTATLAGLMVVFSCARASNDSQVRADESADWESLRRDMVALLRDYGITNTSVLAAMGEVRRHLYIPEGFRSRRTAYANGPSQIGHGQTISQPYIVAYMTECLRIAPGEKVLEIGTGSGYQAAVLAECGATVYTVEIVPELARHAEKVLRSEGYSNTVHVLAGDGYKGWPENAPFDAVIVTCAPEEIPKALVAQLKDGGRMILPLGPAGNQRLVILAKKAGKVELKDDLPVRFVPMVHGKEGDRKDTKAAK